MVEVKRKERVENVRSWKMIAIEPFFGASIVTSNRSQILTAKVSDPSK